MEDDFLLLWKDVNEIHNSIKHNISNQDSKYIEEWLDCIKYAYDIGFFEVPLKHRRYVEWNEFSFVRYDWKPALIGFRSEMLALNHNNNNANFCSCVLAPDNKQLQLSGVDLVQTYYNNKNYKVGIQVKTGRLDANAHRVVVYPDWFNAYTTDMKFFRINVVDINKRAILVADFYDIQRSIISTSDDNWLCDIKRLQSLRHCNKLYPIKI